MTQSKNTQGLPRHTISELVTRYQLEPDLRDLFVEGPRDQDIYSWYLAASGCKLLTVYAIETVEISSDILISHGLASGNRDRVIALALELDAGFSHTLQRVRCIADSDFDFVLNVRKCANHLLYTDYTSVDLYTCDRDLLRKVFRLGFHNPDLQIGPLFDSLISVLQDVFVIRAANEKLGWGMTLVPFIKCCEINGSVITFDRGEFINRCLHRNHRKADRPVFEEVCAKLQTVCLKDPRQGIRSADYYELIGWYLKQKQNWKGYRKDKRSVRTTIMPSVDYNLLSTETLFGELDAVFR